MAASSILSLSSFPRRRFNDSFSGLLFLLIASLAFTTSVFILLNFSSTSKLDFDHMKPVALESPVYTNHLIRISTVQLPTKKKTDDFLEIDDERGKVNENVTYVADEEFQTHPSGIQIASNGEFSTINKDIFHDGEIFHQDYKEMNTSMKIYIYPHPKRHPYANIFSSVSDKSEPGGNYASEHYFKKSLTRSHFITKDPSEADLFYLPFSIANMRNDRRIGVGGIKDFVRDYLFDISHEYPYWNRSGGADHFYVTCHSIGRTAMDKALEIKLNAIQVVCSSSYFVSGYIAHKDASIPQIWPRHGDPPNQPPSKRQKLAFYAGAMNSRVRKALVQTWENDTEISVHHKRLKTPYAESLLGSKFCLHAKGYEVNTARVGDAIYYGCIPVVLADHYDLPFADLLDWKTFSVVVPTLDIPLLKKILQDISFDEYLRLQSNVMKVRNHFQWNSFPVDYDAFYMVMYELWLRRSSVRVYLS